MGTIRQIINEWRQRFDEAGIEDARLNVELLLAHALGVGRGELRARLEDSLTSGQASQAVGLLERRLAREPVDYILGEREFYGRKFHVRPGVLIPRPETEQIIDLAKRMLDVDATGWVADVGCGSGVLAVTLAAEFPKLKVLAIDLHPTPLEVTIENARKHNVEARVHCVRMDGTSAVRLIPHFQLIVSNPPYVTPDDYSTLQPEVRDHEPQQALVGGANGTEIPSRIIQQIAQRLPNGAGCIIEHGPEQSAALCEVARLAGMHDAHTVKDAFGRERFLVATRTPPMDFYALLTIKFSDAVDEVSRAMFAERMTENGWKQAGTAFKLEFDPRSRTTCHSTVEQHLKMACGFARFDRSELTSTVEFHDDKPTTT